MRKLLLFFLITILVFSMAGPVLAAGQVALTITPPLIKNNINPGDVWQSSIKVVNNNSEATDVYVEVRDFKSGRESGTVEFLPPAAEGEDSHLLSSWIVIDNGPIKFEPYESKEITFIIDVPEDASPGGHYAAIMIGTKPPEGEAKGAVINISTLISSLLLLNIGGDAVEEGKIREFSVPQSIYSRPEVDFTVAFENTGNVHIQPKGDIKIYDMFGKSAGSMSLNRGSEFGNVLPGATRTWDDFHWQGEEGVSKMGRYRAELHLNFGSRAIQNDYRAIYFWVLDFKVLGIFFGSLFIILGLLIYLIRAYIRRAILRTQRDIGMVVPGTEGAGKRIAVSTPEKTVVDLKSVVKKPAGKAGAAVKKKKAAPRPDSGGVRHAWTVLKRYFLTVLSVLVLVFAVFGALYWYADKQTPEEAAPSIETGNDQPADAGPLEAGDEIATSSPDKAATTTDEIAVEEAKEEKDIIIDIRNGSGTAGLASKLGDRLEGAGWTIGLMGNADNFDYYTTVIKYKPGAGGEAQALAAELDMKVEMEEADDIDPDIEIIVGKDYK